MANNIGLGMIIGGAVGASLNRAFSDTRSKISELQRKANETRALRNTIRETRELQKEFSRLNPASKEFAETLKKFEANRAILREARIDVGNLGKEYTKLGRTVRGLDLQAAGKERIGQGIAQFKEGIGAATRLGAAAAVPTKISADYQATVRDIAIKGGIARTNDEDFMASRIHEIAKETGIGGRDLATAVNKLVSGGIKVPEALDLAASLARFSVSQGTESGDTAKLILDLRQSGITDPKQMEAMLGKIAVAGNLGAFGSREMTTHFSGLLPTMTAFGMSGEKGAMSLAALLQSQMRGTGDAEAAVAQLGSLFTAITSESTQKSFADQGVNLQGSMSAALLKGYDPVMAFLSITEKAMARQDPARAKEMAQLQERIARAQNPEEAQKLMDGYLAIVGLSELVSNRRAKQAALTAIQNRNLTEENLKLIQSTNGMVKIEKDLADRRDASKQIWSEVGQSWERAMAKFGDAIRPATDLVGNFAKGAGNAMSSMSEKAPLVTASLASVAGVFALYKTGKGLFNVVRGGIEVVSGKWLARGGLGRVLGGAAGGKGGGIGGVLGEAISGVQKVFVVNMPGVGFGLGEALEGGGSGQRGAGQGRLGRMGRTLGGTVRSGMVRTAGLVGLGGSMKTALAAKNLAGIAGVGAGSLSAGAGVLTSSAGAVAASGYLGYQVGKILKPVVDEGLALATGEKDTTLGFKLFDWFSGKDGEVRKMLEGSAPAKEKPAPVQVERKENFSPSLTLNVQGEARNPQELAREVMKELRRLYPEFTRTLDPLYESHHL
ncbi:MAG: phage tail tape measure protein [Betaproteobacteria bacterium]|nr:phage tail tape measure protein [Betaproteobacteria bacterium]